MSDTMLMDAVSGPDYAPNKMRRVRVLRDADMPGFKFCVDVHTKERLVVHASKLRLIPEGKNEG